LASLGHPSKFQRVSRLGFRYCIDVTQRRSTTLCTMFGRLLGWYSVYTFLGGFCPLTEFCQLQNSLCVQVLRSPILAALLHGTPAAGVSQTLRRGTRNGITELSQRAPPIFGWATIALGIGPHSSCFEFLHCSFLFGSVRQIKLAVRYLLSARKYSVCCIPHSAASVRTITRLAAPNSKRR